MDQSGVNPWINGRYDLREVEPLDHFMSAVGLEYLQMHTNAY